MHIPESIDWDGNTLICRACNERGVEYTEDMTEQSKYLRIAQFRRHEEECDEKKKKKEANKK